MRDERTLPARTAASAPPRPDIRAQAARIIEVTRTTWHHDDLNERLAAAAVDHPQRDRLRQELFDDLDTALAVAGLMARLFGYERDGRAPEPLPLRLALPGQRVVAVVRALATPAGNDDFYASGARQQRPSSVARRGAHSCKR